MKQTTSHKPPTTELIVALDVDSLVKAERIVNLLYPQVKIFKIGSQLFTKEGPRAVRALRARGAQVFLDLKFYDIPHTVAQATRAAVDLGVSMLTLHIAGGEQMLRFARKAAISQARCLHLNRPLLFGVTILTSQQDKKVTMEGVLELAAQAKKAGLDGVVTSAQEAPLIRKRLGRYFLIVTPGIRRRFIVKDDQKRVATAKEAKEKGADFIVVGRPIIQAKAPLSATKQILSELK
jgi:orotidine-5'-phosphate decarboxylase